jgi:hypothetical protein
MENFNHWFLIVLLRQHQINMGLNGNGSKDTALKHAAWFLVKELHQDSIVTMERLLVQVRVMLQVGFVVKGICQDSGGSHDG